MDRMIIVSTDSHGGLPAADYRPYLDPQYRDALDDHLRDIDMLQPVLKVLGFPFPDEVLDVVDGRGVVRSGGAKGAYDPVRRLEEAEAEGVVAEVVHPGTQNYGPAPFYEIMGGRYSPELRAAGAKAYNRWLAEFCSAAPGRLIGAALTEPWPDTAAAVTQLHEARKAGLASIWTDQYLGLEGEGPGLWHRSWDPFWAACVDLDLVVHFHVGFGIPQGAPQQMIRSFADLLDPSDTEAIESVLGEMLDTIFPSRRPLWQLMWGGVLDRYPELKVYFVEQHAGWLPATLAYLDQVHARGGTPLTMTPSEYWQQRNLAVTCTSLRPSDLDGRHEVGVEKMMFGTDFPHAEGTWPNTTEWLRAALVGLHEDEARAILGENAIKLYGLDRTQLSEIAGKVGPIPSDLLGGGHVVDQRLIDQFNRRSGFSKPQLASYNEADLAAAVDEDIRSIELSRAS